MRDGNRSADDLRPVLVEYGVQPNADGSVLMRMGNTHVLCAVTVEDKVPPFLKDRGQGWITAEYGMLPCATHSRGRREAVTGVSARSQEIQRLIGRSLRMMVDLRSLGERTLRVDCDVVNADGGTRCASITGAWLALSDACAQLVAQGKLATNPVRDHVAAVSVGIFEGQLVLDLDYPEDSGCDTDMNVVMTGSGGIVEIQGTAEGEPFTRAQMNQLVDMAEAGIEELITKQKETLAA